MIGRAINLLLYYGRSDNLLDAIASRLHRELSLAAVGAIFHKPAPVGQLARLIRAAHHLLVVSAVRSFLTLRH